MEIIERLNAKKTELEERLNNLYHGGSNRRETLEYKIKKIEALIIAYQSASSPANLSEAEEILNQQVGFEEQKEKILNSLRIKNYCETRNIKKNPPILCLVGPPGVGKTTFASILAQALKKEFFMVALGGMSDNSLLVGANESSSGTEIGQLTKALAETKTHNPLILLDEIDKVGSYKTGSVIHSCLSSALDPVQNKEILDYYLDVKLDFSQATFIVTANDLNKIPDYLLSRTPVIVELPGYNRERKKEIANQFIQKWFDQNPSLNRNNLEITSSALETLINKTNEKGVRQLKSALDNIFDYCLLQWAEEANQGKSESKININSDLVHKIIPQDFFNIDQEPEEDNKEKLKRLQKDLENLQKKNNKLSDGLENKQEKLTKIKKNILLILQRNKENINWGNHNYEAEVERADSWEELQVIKEEILLQIRQKPTAKSKGKNEIHSDKLKELEKLAHDLTEKLRGLQQLSNSEREKLKKEVTNLQNQGNKDKILLVVVIIIVTICGVYGILKLLIFLRKQTSERKTKIKG